LIAGFQDTGDQERKVGTFSSRKFEKKINQRQNVNWSTTGKTFWTIS
jgi:hypothetical protein